MKVPALLLLIVLCLSACQPRYQEIDPTITYIPQQRHIAKLPSPFPPLSIDERSQDWGRELWVGISFAQELDLYRAITSFKKARFLLPADATQHRLQIDYSIALCYYLGKKYCDVINTVEGSGLINVDVHFPAYHDLLIILYDAYRESGYGDKAARILKFIEKEVPNTATNLTLSQAITTGNIPCIRSLAVEHPSCDALQEMLCCYCQQAKSASTAQTLNALLPGAGYFYVGQRSTAITSFLLNSLFIWATVRFFEEGHVAAGIITASLEAGWYLGGINGAGLAAKQYNEYLYECYGKEMMLQGGLFPVLMLRKSF